MRRDRRRRSRRNRVKIFILVVEIIVLLVLAISLGAVGGAFIAVSKVLPLGEGISEFEPTEVTKIYSSDGVLLASIFEENREFVPITQIPEYLCQATVATEDKRFYEHVGVDFVGISRAVFKNIKKGRMAEGGSTLTQQLARNIYLSLEKKFSRKLQEMVLAIQLERNYSKEQILELYMNQIFYGSGAYGVQTASRVYFGKDVEDLSLSECALIAGLPQRPSGYSPYRNIEAAKKRRNVVLTLMQEQGYITTDEMKKAKKEEIKLVGLEPTGIAKYKAPWFVMYVLDELSDSHRFSEDIIYRGGLRIYTTLNYEMQKIAEKELRKHVAKAKSRNVSQGALICIEPSTGHIKAMVGGVNPDYTKDQFNRAVQAKRQPGSAFKAFVYTAAIDNGYDATYRVSNKPITYKGKPWPKNYSSKQKRSSYTIKEAVKQSVNIPAVRMAESLGIQRVIMYAKMMGIKSPLHPNLALALGADVVSPLELCSAYGVFPANGIRAEPVSVVKVAASHGDAREDVLAEYQSRTRRVLSEQTAGQMNYIFRSVVAEAGGTGSAARKVPNSHGKTGTTTDDRDAWFVGYTPELTTVVWVGNDDYTKSMNNVWGGNVCARTWAAFMSKAVDIYEKEHEGQIPQIITYPLEFDKDAESKAQDSSQSNEVSVRICAESGLLATPDCPTTYQATFEMGSEPTTKCPIHAPPNLEPSEDDESPQAPQPQPAPTTEAVQPGTTNNAAPPGTSGQYITVTICVDTGQIANRFCPETIPKRFLKEEAPKKVCTRHRPPEM